MGDRLPVPPEDYEQRVVCRWLDAHRILYAHVPNGGYRTRVEAARFRSLGVRAGVPDLLVFDPPPAQPEARGLAIEMKRQRGGRLTEHQREWLGALEERGWCTVVAHGAEAAISELQRLGYGSVERWQKRGENA